MRRRTFIAGLGGAAASVYSARCNAQAQPSRVYRLGYLAPGRIPYVLEAFQDGLRKLGYVEGQNLKIEYRFLQESGNTPDALAAELVQLGPDLIVAVATPMAVAAKRATTTIPIVLGPVADPLHSGIVMSSRIPRVTSRGRLCTGPSLAASGWKCLSKRSQAGRCPIQRGSQDDH
jgi:putative ABC transport system substrate-binding protein